MGVIIPNGYHVCVPSMTLTGSTHIFQVALMGKTKVGDAVATTRASWTDALTAQTLSPLKPSMVYIGWTLASVKVSQMDAGVLTVDEDVTAFVGTKTGSLGTTCNTSILTKKPTGIAGRRYRGRAMWPNLWVPEANVSQAGILQAGEVTNVNNIMSTLDSRLVGLGILSYLGHSVAEVAPTVLTGPMQCVQKVGTIKRRIRGSS